MDWYGLSDPALIADVGKRLKEQRLRKNYTQQELAEKSGVSLGSVIKIEKGHSVSFSTIVVLMRTLRLLENFELWIPKLPISPIELSKLQGKTKQRASKNKSRNTFK
jgi:transcriptional regulator with XRE-family HTH domain